MKNLRERTAVITGAGSGIGRATSLALAAKGCRLALADIDAAGLAETERQVQELGRPVTTHVVDVSDRARMEQFAREVADAHGGANIVINNAGVAVTKSFVDHSIEDFEWLMGINFWGVVYGCKFFMPQLLAGPEGHVVNISSVFGLIGVPEQSSYCASKFAVRGFSEALRVELAHTNVGVTSVHPGGVATQIAANMRMNDSPDAHAARARIVRNFKKMLAPSVVAAAIVRGIERNKPRVLIARETYVADFAKRFLPAVSGDLMAWGYERYRARHVAR